MWRLRLLTNLHYPLLQVSKRQRNGEKLFKNLRKVEGYFENYMELSMLFLQRLNWNLSAFLTAFSHFDLNIIHEKKKIEKAFKILK